MVLDVGGNLFGNRNFLEKPNRTATIIVAKDGSGDTDGVAEGISLLPPDGGVVYIKEGTYTLSTGILLTDNISLIGSGKGTEIEVSNAITMFTAVAKVNILIKSINFVNVGGGTGSTFCIYFNNCGNCHIQQCWIQDFVTEGIRIFGGDYIKIDDCKIFGGAGLGIKLQGYSAGTSLNYCQVTNNYIYNMTGSGLVILANAGKVCNYNLIANNQIHTNGAWGVDIQDNRCDRNVVVGNFIYNNTSGNLQDIGTNTTNSGNLVA